MSTKTFVQVTADESSPGVPLWSVNQNITQVPDGETTVSIENLVAGRKYYVQTWNEDEFGNRSPSIVRVVQTAAGVKTVPIAFSANGYLDDGSPMRAFVKIADDVQSISEVVVTLAFREFMAPAQDAASSGTLTTDSGGGSTTPSGGGSTSGSSSSSSSGGTAHNHKMFERVGAAGAHSTDSEYNDFSADTVYLAGPLGDLTTFLDSPAHTHSIGHTHSTPSHTHSTPNHQHTTPGHTHALTYGTFEETYPASHSVKVRVYERVSDTWTLRYTSDSITEDLADLDLTDVIIGPGDWRIEVLSDAGQPNAGRLGLDIYGAITAVTSGSSSDGLAGIGTAGPAGTPGVGVPTGGTSGQVLYKLSGADYDTGWLTLGSAALADTTDFDAAGAAAAAQTAAEAYADTVGVAAEAYADGVAAAAEAASQPLDSDLTDIAALTPSNDDILQRKAGAWTNRTIAQLKSDISPTAGPDADVTIDTAGAAGSSNTFARSGHGHKVATTAGPGADVTVDSAGAAGATGVVARAGHGHKLSTSSSNPVALGTAAPGTSGRSPSRDDHVHPTTGLALDPHGAAQHTDITRTLWMSKLQLAADGATAGTQGTAPDATDYWNLADGATQGVYGTFHVPENWASGTIKVIPVWFPQATDAASHAVRWSLDVKSIANNQSVAAGGTVVTQTGTSQAQTAARYFEDASIDSTVTPASVNETLRINLRRVGADAADTYVGDVRLIGLLISYTANQ